MLYYFPMSGSSVFLLGLDIGSTTTHLMIAEADLLKNCVTGRMEFNAPKILFKSEPIFTPFQENEIDLKKLSDQISHWLNQSKINLKNLVGGGAIVTGLASKKNNALKIKAMVKQLVSESIVATAEDPHLESWLAFKGNCTGLLKNEKILNFDIGGGTTNLAIGDSEEVQSTGCLFIGARHFQFKPGTFQLTGVTEYGQRLLTHLKIQKKIGEELEQNQITQIVTEYVSALEEIAQDKPSERLEKLYDYSVALKLKSSTNHCTIVFSGGVAELLYRYAKGEMPNQKTSFGDLGEELALGILQSKILSHDLKRVVPTNSGRATVFGMTLYQVEVSGTTTYISDHSLLPLEDIPIVTTLDLSLKDDQLIPKIKILTSAGSVVGAYLICNPSNAREQFSHFANIFQALPETKFVFFLENNLGKTFGNYLTDWGKSSLKCIVIDEVPLKSAQFASLGRMLQNSIPVSFYGMK